MVFQKGHKFYRSHDPSRYAWKKPRKEDYEPCDKDRVPVGVVWKRAPYCTNPKRYFTVGWAYMMIHDEKTGTTSFFRRKDNVDKINAAAIDAEPKPKKHYYGIGTQCWLIVNKRWFHVQIVERPAKSIILRTITGRDADREVGWPFDDLFEFKTNSWLYRCLRPLSDRKL